MGVGIIETLVIRGKHQKAGIFLRGLIGFKGKYWIGFPSYESSKVSLKEIQIPTLFSNLKQDLHRHMDTAQWFQPGHSSEVACDDLLQALSAVPKMFCTNGKGPQGHV